MSDGAAPEILDGRYVLEAPIGQGAMGAVWRARQLSLERPVAVKLIEDARGAGPAAAQLEARFVREAKVLSRLRHPGIVAVIDFGVADGRRPYLVMELVEGPSLEAVLAERGALPADEVARIVLGLARALEHAHTQGVLHRDLKPSNVLFDGKDTKLVDFGIARPLEDASLELTQAGMLVGTPAYAAPEQLVGQALDARTDLYALGVVAYRCLRGELPFRADSLQALLHQQIAVPAPRLAPTAPPDAEALAALVDALLEKDPARRPASAADVVAALEGVADTAIRAAPPLPRGPSAPAARARSSPREAPAPLGPRRARDAVVLAGVGLVASAMYAAPALWLSRAPTTDDASSPAPLVAPLDPEADTLRALRRRIDVGDAAALDEVERLVEASPKSGTRRALLAYGYVVRARADDAAENYAWVARNAPEVLDDADVAKLRTLAASTDVGVALPARAALARAGARALDGADVVARVEAGLDDPSCRARLGAVSAARTLADRALVAALTRLAGKAGECGSAEAGRAAAVISGVDGGVPSR